MTLLLATDFDGTVAPIVDRPEDASLDGSMREFFSRIQNRRGVVLAFLSGREAADLRRRTAPLRAYVSGSHGLECLGPDGGVLWEPQRELAPPAPEILEALTQRGVRIEHKRYAISLHFRGTDIDGHDPAVTQFLSWARQRNLDIVTGRRVIETRFSGGGKCAALRLLAFRTGATRVIYAGDDLPDFRALAWAGRAGRAFFVQSNERESPDSPGVQRVFSIAELRDKLSREILGSRAD